MSEQDNDDNEKNRKKARTTATTATTTITNPIMDHNTSGSSSHNVVVDVLDRSAKEKPWDVFFDNFGNCSFEDRSSCESAIAQAIQSLPYTMIGTSHSARPAALINAIVFLGGPELPLDVAEAVVKIQHSEDHKSMEEKWGVVYKRFRDRRGDDKDDGATTLSALVHAIEEASRDVSYAEIESRNHAARASVLQKRVRQLTLDEAEAVVKIQHSEDHKSMEEKWGVVYKRFRDRRGDDKDDGATTLSALVHAIEEASRDVSYTEIENGNHAARARVLQKRVRQLTFNEAEAVVKILHSGEPLSPDSAGGRGMNILDGLNVDLVHEYDLNKFSLRIDELFDWHNDKCKQAEYMAPYFAVVQSSGMGKTKLFTEYRKRKKFGKTDDKNNITVKTILCVEAGLEPDDELLYYDHQIDRTIKQQTGGTSDVVANVWDFLDQITADKMEEGGIEKDDNRGCVLLFDEAQGLMTRKDEQHGLMTRKDEQHDDRANLMFRAIRWWLRMDRARPFVAVFAGTTTKLSNFFPPDPPKAGTSRKPLVQYKNLYEEMNSDRATALYPPFFELHTISCLRGRGATYDDACRLDPKFPNAALYGRPLFAHYCIEGRLEDEAILGKIAKRLVLSATDYSKSLAACYSVLGSRVQMGTVNSFDTLSHLVSSGYACLVEFREGDGVRNASVAGVTFMPDPVCATLAMRFMDKDYLVNKETLGKDKAFWVQQAERAFSSKLCQPDKGDVGEVFAALYVLLCGDVLRKRDDPTLSKFSVSLDEWFTVLRNGGKSPGGEQKNDAGSAKPATRRFTRSMSTDIEDSCSRTGVEAVVECTVSFIQICRNDLRSNSFCGSSHLEWLHKSGVGCYTYKNCRAFDIAASIKVVTRNIGDTVKYHPLLISVKNWSKAMPSDIAGWRLSFVSFLQEIRESGDPSAVCIILLVGCTDLPKLTEEMSTKSLKPFPESDVFRLISVPDNDEFGISTAINNISNNLEPVEIFSSHAFMTCEEESSPLSLLLRKSSKTNIDELFRALHLSGAESSSK